MPPDSASARPIFKRLTLTMPEHDKKEVSGRGPQALTLSTPSNTHNSQNSIEHDSSGSPQRPSYSPVTPTLSQASLASQGGTGVDLLAAQWMDETPEPLPLSLDDNPDAIALRATLSILQIQRQQALKDIRELDKMKNAAVERPEEFVKELQTGRLSRQPRLGVDVDDFGSTDVEQSAANAPKFGHFPAAQNIVRTPPVEWAKYHIVGEPLERIHHIQQQFPGSTEENIDQIQPQAIAEPYRPFVDRLDQTKLPVNPRTSGP